MNTSTASTSPSRDSRYLFVVLAAAMALSVFVGFAPSYYLRTAPVLKVLRPTLQAHGILFTAWMVLFIIQAALIRIGKTPDCIGSLAMPASVWPWRCWSWEPS